MVARSPVVPVSDSIAKALERLFKTGGFALAFGFGGLLLIVVSPLAGAQLKIPTFAVGYALTFICLAFFLVSSIRTRHVAQRIKDNLPLLDGLQRIALDLTEVVSLSQAVAFKHLVTIQQGLKTMVPLIEHLPVVGAAVRDAGLADASKLLDAIVTATESAKQAVRDVDEVIRSGDLRRLTAYASTLEEALGGLRRVLKGSSER